VRSFDHKSPLF